MITTVLKGGLGNQMFQYAIARHVAALSNTEVALDTLFYLGQRTYAYPFQLGKFYLTALGDPVSGKLICEPGLQYHSGIVDAYTENIILSGYWQDERYFKDVRDLLLRDFVLKPEYMSEEYCRTADFLMGLSNPVFVHVRRGERAHNKNAKNVHGLISEAYYAEAIMYLLRKRPKATLIFFSDDYEYTKEEYGLLGKVVKPMNDYEHFSLMTLCDHAIIANSSFSWWAAWLMQSRKKIVVAPSAWTTNINNSNKEIIPREWRKLHLQYA